MSARWLLGNGSVRRDELFGSQSGFGGSRVRTTSQTRSARDVWPSQDSRRLRGREHDSRKVDNNSGSGEALTNCQHCTSLAGYGVRLGWK